MESTNCASNNNRHDSATTNSTNYKSNHSYCCENTKIQHENKYQHFACQVEHSDSKQIISNTKQKISGLADFSVPTTEKIITKSDRSAMPDDSNAGQKSHVQSSTFKDVTGWLTSDVCGEGPITRLNEREWAFWNQLIKRYLQPFRQGSAVHDGMKEKLRELRNNVVFGFTMVSAMWIALTMQLEARRYSMTIAYYIYMRVCVYTSILVC